MGAHRPLVLCEISKTAGLVVEFDFDYFEFGVEF